MIKHGGRRSALARAAAALLCGAWLSGGTCSGSGDGGGGAEILAGSGAEVFSAGPCRVVRNALNLGSFFPSAIVIPDLAGFQETAWIVQPEAPIGVRPVEIGGFPLLFSSGVGSFPDFFGFPPGAKPDEIIFVRGSLAAATTSIREAVLFFNPLSGAVRLEVSTDRFLSLPAPGTRFPGGESVSFLATGFTSGAAVSQGKLFVAMSNFRPDLSDSSFDPGVVLIFDVDLSSSPPSATPSSPFFLKTSGYNPTEVTPLGDHLVLVTNSGANRIEDAIGVPLTEASIDVIDALNSRIVATIPLGLAFPSFKPIAIDPSESVGVVGSAAFRAIFAFDLRGLEALVGTAPDRVIFDASNPFKLPMRGDSARPDTGRGFTAEAVFSNDGGRIYVSDFEDGTVTLIDVDLEGLGPADPVTAGRFRHRATVAVAAQIPSATEEVRPGPMALRPGEPGVDFTGPELFLLTGSPDGTVVTLECGK